MIANQKNIANFKASKRIIEIIKGDLKWVL
jgi:hypothetical protein